tara:strand:- start:3131 stop:3484 length:354 start_codon:yes stop_codon:yes gene_type:complete
MVSRYPERGTVIRGTHRPQDLVPRLLDELTERIEHGMPGARSELESARAVNRLQDFMGKVEEAMQVEGYYESDEAMFDLELLFDYLDQCAGPDSYFGAHVGDGSDFGFWATEEHPDV